ncbi:MAG TPA: hypothetical protein PKJ99_03125 [Thermoanaerobaculales bacterium]|nr:hypothetical protein [Thermoanaerobaculales bacterium]HQL31465.1 hypothetical protein [Thermoanaerobaculales bacterium]
MAGTKPRLGFLKRGAFAVAAVLLGLLAAELLVFLGYLVVRRQPFPRASYRASMARAADAGQTATDDRGHSRGLWRTGEVAEAVEVVHPYLGFVVHPDLNPATSPQGFPMDDPLPVSRAPGRLVVAVFGGSFAAGFSLDARDLLVDALAPLGREVVIVNLAAGGYKQPQQLLALTWALSLGSQFDLVINIDGFNEVVLPAVDNLPRGVYPFYPRAWDQRVAGFFAPEEARIVAAIAAADGARSAWARRFLALRLDRSIVMCVLWRARDLALERERGRLAQRFEEAHSKAMSGFLARGPAVEFPGDEDALYDSLAGYWHSCSLQMHRLCEANGIRYYHFLQPNQYLAGAKPMGRQERAVALRPNHPYRASVVRGYPWLRRHGAELSAAGVRFTDLTMVFSEVRRPVYTDDCCHVARAGYRLIADEIARVVGAGEDRQ